MSVLSIRLLALRTRLFRVKNENIFPLKRLGILVKDSGFYFRNS